MRFIKLFLVVLMMQNVFSFSVFAMDEEMPEVFSDGPSSDHAPEKSKRTRIVTHTPVKNACTNCRMLKVRCIQNQGAEKPCAKCRKKNKKCVYEVKTLNNIPNNSQHNKKQTIEYYPIVVENFGKTVFYHMSETMKSIYQDNMQDCLEDDGESDSDEEAMEYTHQFYQPVWSVSISTTILITPSSQERMPPGSNYPKNSRNDDDDNKDMRDAYQNQPQSPYNWSIAAALPN